MICRTPERIPVGQRDGRLLPERLPAVSGGRGLRFVDSPNVTFDVQGNHVAHLFGGTDE